LEIIYTGHLKFRLKIREITYELPKKLFLQSEEHYYDKLTKHHVAIASVRYKGRVRKMAIGYDELKDRVEIITIHPLKTYQKQARIKAGRWVKK
jgi:hypothetical protein